MGPISLSGIGALVVAIVFSSVGGAQGVPAACGVPPISAATAQANIFNDQQEEWLGEAMADVIEREYKPARDEAQSAYLQAIVDRLAKQLPPTQIRFRVLVVDSSEVNGFSLAGGHIYITRKLAALARNDDELATVLGHEMGHIASHQFAFETTRDMKRLLGITSVGDRSDIYVKFQKLMDAAFTDKHPSRGGDSDSGQDEADKVGVYVSAAAGYRPAAYGEFWDRVFFTQGKTGSRVTDFFGITKPDQKRLRGILKLIAALPAGCGAATPVVSASFKAWHDSVVANQVAAIVAHMASVSEVKLTPPIRMDLDRVRFSPDGKTILAQDRASVFAIAREPYGIRFRFDAENAMPAQFSPDSQKIVFGTPGLHSEEWSVTEKKMLTAHEPLARHECLQSQMSPDGRTVVCMSLDDELWEMRLSLLDSSSGDTLWEKKDFFKPTFYFALLTTYSHDEESTAEWLQSSFSADGNFLLIGPADAKIAFDLRTRTPIKIGGDLKNKVTGAYAFIGNNLVVGVNNMNPKDSGIFSFPEGKMTQKVNLPVNSMQAVSGDDGTPFVLVDQMKEPGTGLADVRSEKFILKSQGRALDSWNGYLATEEGDGSVMLAKLKEGAVTDKRRVALPLSPLGSLRASAISPSGKYIALSTPNHGGVWNLVTGRREFLIPGFTGVSWKTDDSLYVEFPKIGTNERKISELSVSKRSANNFTYTVDDKTHLNYRLLTEWKDMGKRGWQFALHNPADNSVLWGKTFTDGSPRYTRSFGSGDLLFTSQLKLGSVKARVKASPALAAEAAGVKIRDNGRLLEVVDATTGKTSAEMVLELPPNYDGTDGLNSAGDLLYMTASDNRTVVYSLATGKQLRQIFGTVIAIDPESQKVCTVNRRDEAVVYDAAGRELAHFHIGTPLRFANFQAKGAQLMLLTADQTVRIVDVAKGDAGTAVAEK
jgi:hypothetical protein